MLAAMTSLTSLATYLDRFDEPMHGTTLIASDFRFFAEAGRAGWRVNSHLRDGRAVRFTIWSTYSRETRLTPHEMRCEYHELTDARVPHGMPMPLRDPFRRTLGDSAPVQDWYDAIRFQDVGHNAVLRDEKNWGGDGLEDMVVRSERGISKAELEEVAVAGFSRLADFQTWVDDTLSGTQVRIEVLALSDYPDSFEEPLPGQLLQGFDGDEWLGYLESMVSTDHDSRLWLTSNYDVRLDPQAAVRMSGAQLMGFNASAVMNWRLLREDGAVRRGPDVPWPAPDGWLLLGIVGTDAALPVPASTANVWITVADDFATVAVSVLPTAERERLGRARADFERRWGRWLDPDEPISEREIEREGSRVEAELRALREAELTR